MVKQGGGGSHEAEVGAEVSLPPRSTVGVHLLETALSKWDAALKKLLVLERRTPPGRLKISDFQRLVKSRAEHHDQLLAMGDEMLDYAPLLSKKSMSQKLECVAEQARRVADFEVMVNELLPLYGDPANVAREVGLAAEWQEQASSKFRKLDVEIRGMVALALPPRVSGAM